VTTANIKNVEDELVNFARSLVKDPKIRHTNTSETFEGDNVTTDFVLENKGVCINSVTVDDVAQKWGTDYTYDGDTQTVSFTTAPESGIAYDFDWHPVGTFDPVTHDDLEVWSKVNWNYSDVAEIELGGVGYSGNATNILRLEYDGSDHEQGIKLTFPTKGVANSGTIDISFDWKWDTALQYQHFFKLFNEDDVMIDEIDYAGGVDNYFSLMVIWAGGGSWQPLPFTPTFSVQQSKWYRLTWRCLDQYRHQILLYDYETETTYTSAIANNADWASDAIDNVKYVIFNKQTTTPLKYSIADVETSWDSGINHYLGSEIVINYDYGYYWGYWGYPAVSTAPGNYPAFGITWLESDSKIGDVGANFILTDRFFRIWVYDENQDVIKSALNEFRGDFFNKNDWYLDGKAYNRIIPVSMFKEPVPDERRVAGKNRWLGSYQDFVIPNMDES